ncbi:MAG TPA: biotin carboxylase, partial [Chitinophagales bacterium]|nr:biotin carboxylase [Chitinophagales bacterium]
KKMIRAIQDYQISGVATTLPFGTFVMQHEAFLSGNFDTKFIERYFTPEALQLHDEEASAIAAFLAARLMESEKSAETQSAIATQTTKSKWLERKRM